MSKITQEKKEAKLKGKPAKTAASKKNKAPKVKEAVEQPKPSIPNINKCCTCRYRNVVKQCTGKTSPKLGQYVARKLDACPCYKCKVA